MEVIFLPQDPAQAERQVHFSPPGLWDVAWSEVLSAGLPWLYDTSQEVGSIFPVGEQGHGLSVTDLFVREPLCADGLGSYAV